MNATRSRSGRNRARVYVMMSVISFAMTGMAPITAFAQGEDEPLFIAPWRAFDTGEFPRFSAIAIELGDLDGDGDDDALIGHDYFGEPGIAVLRGNGDGTFAAPEPYDTGDNRTVGDVALADIDRDGDLDALATVPDSFGFTNLVRLWRNTGDGALGAPRDFLTGAGPVGLVVADFNGDSFPDLATANNGYLSRGDTVSILAHNGRAGAAAGFLPPQHFTATADVQQLDAADIDGDGDVDLVAGGSTAQGNAILFNDGAGSFGAPTLYEHAPGYTYPASAVAFGDFNGDGAPDLLAVNAYNGLLPHGIVALRLNNGAGAFGPAQLHRLADMTWTISNLRVIDLNEDGRNDLLLTTPTTRAMDGWSILFGDGDGGFASPQFYKSAKGTWDINATDADADGDLDVLACAYDSSVIAVHLNAGDASFLRLTQYEVGFLSDGMDHADIDHDGDLDIVTSDSHIRILRNNGDGAFQPAAQYTPPTDPGDVHLVDLNNDGFADLLMGPDSGAPPYGFSTALNLGDGTFDAGHVTPVSASQAGKIAAVDLDGDGYLDVALEDHGPASLIHLARNPGDGQVFDIMPPLVPPGLPFGIAGADFNHDGHVDLVSSTAHGLTIFRGNGDFTFQKALTEGVQAPRFTIDDLNGDGHPDVAAMLAADGYGPVDIATFLGYGDGDLAPPTTYIGPMGREGSFQISSDIDTGDVNGDRIPDVILTSNAPNDVSIWPGVGDGTLIEPDDRYGAGYSARYSSIGDFSGNGTVDLATHIALPPAGFTGAIIILEGTTPGGGGGEVFLTINGSCPGEITLTVRGATPGRCVAFLYAFGKGAIEVPPGNPCAGTRLGLDNSATLLDVVAADNSGVAQLNGDAPPQVCGRAFIQALDLATCATTSVEDL